MFGHVFASPLPLPTCLLAVWFIELSLENGRKGRGEKALLAAAAFFLCFPKFTAWTHLRLSSVLGGGVLVVGITGVINPFANLEKSAYRIADVMYRDVS